MRPHVPERASGQRVPEFFIVGNPKSGTTAPIRDVASLTLRFFMPELEARAVLR